jgi:hypothetical protein
MPVWYAKWPQSCRTGRGAAARAVLQHRFADPPKLGLKALFASAPLEGIDLTRERDLGRDVDL